MKLVCMPENHIMETLVPQLDIRIFGIHRSRSEQEEDIDNLDRQDKLGEDISKSLLNMHKAIISINSESRLFWEQVMNAGDSFRGTFINNLSPFFTQHVEEYLKDFSDNLRYFEEVRIQGDVQLFKSIKDNSCPGSLNRYEEELDEKLAEFNNIRPGGSLNSSHVTNLIDAYRKITRCYSEGIEFVVRDLTYTRVGSRVGSRVYAKIKNLSYTR